jgi:hypothetical protein
VAFKGVKENKIQGDGFSIRFGNHVIGRYQALEVGHCHLGYREKPQNERKKSQLLHPLPRNSNTLF